MITMLILGAGLLTVCLWAMCAAGGRADDDMTRYFRTQQRKVRQHGCATKVCRT